MKGIRVYEEEYLQRSDWINKLSYLEEQAGSKVSVVVVRANDLKLAAILKYRRKYSNSHTQHVTVHPNYCYRSLVSSHGDPFPPMTEACYSEQLRAGEKKPRPQITRLPVTNA